MIDVTSIINDPDFNLPFNIIHVNGVFDTVGEFIDTETVPEALTGIVLPAKLDELDILPEGERLKGSIAVYCLSPLTMGEQVPVIAPTGEETFAKADVIEYPPDSKQFYRVAYSRYYAQCVLWYGLATRYQRAN